VSYQNQIFLCLAEKTPVDFDGIFLPNKKFRFKNIDEPYWNYIQMAEAIITSCHKTLQSVNEFRATVRETWIDCDRVCERMSLFQDIIVNKQTNPELLSRTKREFDVLAHLDKVLRQSLQFMTAHTTRSSFKGFTDLALRENYMMDLAKNNLLVAKLTKELSLADDIDYEKIREEDYLVRHNINPRTAFLNRLFVRIQEVVINMQSALLLLKSLLQRMRHMKMITRNFAKT